jgi:hypothetical protein
MRFLRFKPKFGHALATVNAAKSAQNCPKLPKSIQRQNFEIPSKIESLVFFKKKNLCV